MTRDGLERESGEPGRLDEPGHRRIAPEERVPAVDVEPAGQDERRFPMLDLSVTLIREGGPGRLESRRLAAKEERGLGESDGLRPPVQPGNVAAVSPVGEEQVRVLPDHLLSERGEERLFRPLEGDIPQPDGRDRLRTADEAVPATALEFHLEPRPGQRRKGVVNRLRRFERDDGVGVPPYGSERVELVLEMVEMRRGQVHVVELEPGVPAPGIDRRGDPATIRVPARGDR